MSGRSFHVRMRLTKEGGRISLDTRAERRPGARADQLHHARERPQAHRGHLPAVRAPHGAAQRRRPGRHRRGAGAAGQHPAAALAGRARQPRPHAGARAVERARPAGAGHRRRRRRPELGLQHLLPPGIRSGAQRVLPVQRRRGRGLRSAAVRRRPRRDLLRRPRRTIRPSSWRWCSRCACASTRSTRTRAVPGASAAAPAWSASWSCWRTRPSSPSARTTSCSRPPASTVATRAAPAPASSTRSARRASLAPMSDGNVLRRGDVLRLATSGGGGWGHPFDRPLDRVRRDSWPASCRSTPPAPTTARFSTPPGCWTCRHPRHCAARSAARYGCSIAMATSGHSVETAADGLASLAYSDGGTVQSRHIADAADTSGLLGGCS